MKVFFLTALMVLGTALGCSGDAQIEERRETTANAPALNGAEQGNKAEYSFDELKAVAQCL